MAIEKIHCVFIGIDEYQDSSIPRLRCAVRDAIELGELFDGIRANVTLLLNSQATLISIRRALWGLSAKVDENDTAIVYYAGHGACVSIPQRNRSPKTVPCLVPYDSQLDHLLASSISMEEIGRCFESIPCKRVLFFFDSCYSGAIANARTFPTPHERTLAPNDPILPSIAGNGKVIIAASLEYQPAFEDPNTGHGIFTECLIEALSGKAANGCEEELNLDMIYKYLQDNVSRKSKSKFNKTQTPFQHGTFTERFIFPVMKPIMHRTLAGFPQHFLPITIVVGDRRETTPKTAGDLFALSASPAELRWILGLRLPHDTEIVSDKVFLQADDNYLKEHFSQRNLLIVGSPAANLLAREINNSAFFPFSVPIAAKEQYKQISLEIKKIANNRAKLVNFQNDPQNRDTLAFYMNLFRKGGFIDPTYSYQRRGDRIPHDRDYGTITLARNPYADPESANFLSILVAGVSLPGTMHGIAWLGNARHNFAERPFGGIFFVELTDLNWVRRVTNGMPDWSTESYDIGKLRKGLQELKMGTGVQDEFTDDEIADRINLLEQITE